MNAQTHSARQLGLRQVSQRRSKRIVLYDTKPASNGITPVLVTRTPEELFPYAVIVANPPGVVGAGRLTTTTLPDWSVKGAKDTSIQTPELA